MARPRLSDREPGTSVPVVAPVATVEDVMTTEPPTLSDAFHTLCYAMMPLLEDNQPSLIHCQEIMAWHADGNVHVAMQHAVQILEEVMGVRLGHA